MTHEIHSFRDRIYEIKVIEEVRNIVHLLFP